MNETSFDDYDEGDYEVEYLIEDETTIAPDRSNEEGTASGKDLGNLEGQNKYLMWTAKDTDLLLKDCEKYHDLVQKNRNLFYEKVHRSLVSLGAKKHSLNDIRTKFKNLLTAYKKHIAHENKSGGGDSKFKFGMIMDRIMEKSPSIVNNKLVSIGCESNPAPLEAAVQSTSAGVGKPNNTTSLNKTLALIREVHKEGLDDIRKFIKEENLKKMEAKERRHRERTEQLNEFLDTFKKYMNK